jgi:hypothetical protein
MRSILVVLGLLIALSTSADAATMHHSRTRHHLSPNVASSFNFAPGWGYERTAPSVYEDARTTLEAWLAATPMAVLELDTTSKPHSGDPGVGLFSFQDRLSPSARGDGDSANARGRRCSPVGGG